MYNMLKITSNFIDIPKTKVTQTLTLREAVNYHPFLEGFKEVIVRCMETEEHFKINYQIDTLEMTVEIV